MQKKANIYDVAKLAGVSHQTVSRVLNNHSSLKPATREKVEQAIADLAYRPNQAARQLVTSKSRMIGVLIAESELFGPSSMLNAMQDVARKEGYSVISISVIAKSRDSWREGIEQLRNLDVDGVITIALHKDIVKEIERYLIGTTIVLIGSEPSQKFNVVNMDNVMGARLATQHLIDLGHTEIVHVSGPEKAYEAQMRRVGYEDAMKESGLVPKVFSGTWGIDSGYQAGKEIVGLKRLPTAIFCANDHSAIGVLRVLYDHDISVPDQMSVVGYDNIPEAEYLIPSLTTIRPNFNALGNAAIDKMLMRLRQGALNEAVMLKPEVIVRNSSGPIQSGKRKK
jgi:DNA-binding LacI/PurR family transcriptional regulator